MTDTLKIGLFSDSYPPIMDGVALTVRNYAYWLNEKKNPSYVVTPRFPGYSDKDNFPVLRYISVPIIIREPYRLGLPELDYGINHTLKNLELDIVHAHSPFSAGLLAMRTARRNHIPVVATFHSKYRDDFARFVHQKTILRQVINRIVDFYQMADEVWIPQPHVEETIREYGYRGKLEVVGNGIDMNVDDDIHAFRSLSRKSLNIPENKKVFLFVGQLILEKNLKFLMESLRYVTTADYIIYFVGQGYARPLLEKLAHDFNLTGKVMFAGPVYDREQMKRYYAAADLFVFPSMYDNAPLVLLEAAAMHTPALVLKGSTIGEMINDGFNGFLSDNDQKNYAERISMLIEDKELLKNAGEKAAMTLCRSWQEIVDEVKDRYISLCKRKQD